MACHLCSQNGLDLYCNPFLAFLSLVALTLYKIK